MQRIESQPRAPVTHKGNDDVRIERTPGIFFHRFGAQYYILCVVMATPQAQNTPLAAGNAEEGATAAADMPITLPPPAQLPTTQQERSPAIDPRAEGDGAQLVQGWSKREFHKWLPPFYLALFFLLGLTMSIAHCVFYPKLRGNLVGDSYSQEEKLRYALHHRAMLRT